MPKKKLWILKRTGKINLDEMERCVVCAGSVNKAREVAARHAMDEGMSAWRDSSASTCEVLEPGDRSAMVLMDVRTG